jgi:hypothetical protein
MSDGWPPRDEQRTRRARVATIAYAASGSLLLVLAALGLAGIGPLAP